MGRVEVITFNSIKFRRYPDAKSFCARNYYTPGMADKRKGVDMLHREVWKAHNGPIPHGFHVHHKHGTSRNEIDDLECLSPDEHAARHPDKAWAHRAGHRDHLKKIRPMAALWHHTEEGRKWHSEHIKRLNNERVFDHPFVCTVCGSNAISRQKEGAKFCTRACAAKARRNSGLDNIVKNCEHCAAEFTANRFEGVRFCSRVCVKRDYWRKKKSLQLDSEGLPGVLC